MPHASRLHRPTLAAAVAAALAVGTSAPAVAAEPAADSLLQEVVVTAQKRTESAQDVPISIVALSGETLERLNTTDVLQVAARTPTLQYSQAGGEAQLYVRGVGSNLLAIGSDPSVAIHQDGVYLGRPNMGLTQFLDVERVEVLRGPQGTLYGRNATGGAVNIVSRMPTRENEGYFSAGTGSFDRVDLKAAWNAPLNDATSVRIAARSLRDDGYVENRFPGGTNLDDNDLRAVRGSVRIQPSDAFRLDLIIDYSKFENGNTAIVPNDGFGAAQALGAVPTGSKLEVRNNVPSFQNWETGGPTATLEWRPNDAFSVTYVGSYRKFDQDFLFNTDGTEIEVTRTSTKVDSQQHSHELRLASTGDAPLQWIAGGYYLKEDKEGTLGLVRLNLATPGVFLLPATGITDARAVFGQVDWTVLEGLKLTAGIRWSEERKTDFNQQINVFASATNPVAQIERGLYGNLVLGAPATTRSGENTWRAWTPKFGLDYRLTDDVLLYASYTKGFKSGGYNSYQPSNPVFEPEFIKSYEVGAKTDWAGGRFRANVSAFYYDYSDLQVTTFFQSLTLVSNAAEATIQGVDLELLASPVDGLNLGASVSWLDATYDEFLFPYGLCSPLVLNTPSCAGATAGAVRVVNAEGNRLNNAPEIKANAFATYRFPLGGAGSLEVLGQVSYTDDIYFNAANDPNLRQPAYTLVDARVSWTNPAGNLEVAAYGKNLGDEEYFHNIIQFTSTSLPPPRFALPAPGARVTDPFSIGNALGYPAPGRTWGVDLTYRF
ncbi:MAG: TonB-dependent receptor [Steroidobacteraceae bacterium]|jgi:iron complex outermembrane receptor protein|nr:TonB-dependent receptor [Steroidobacteraceae bacterium]